MEKEKIIIPKDAPLSVKRSMAARIGGGRPAGTKNVDTLLREEALKEYRKKVVAAADVLFNQQLLLARGCSYLFKIEKEVVEGPRGGKKYINKKPVIVTSPVEIEDYLLNRINGGDAQNDQDPDAAYYFITTEKGDTRTIDSMLDRIWGKPTQIVATEDENGNKKALEANSITFINQNES